MKILVVGKGGREHALVQALSESPSRPELYAYPGSDGMSDLVQRVDAPDVDALVAWMSEKGIDLCVAGEEAYLVKGLSDKCREAGIRAWGPVAQSAQLEGSKIFAKEFLFRNGIPTGGYEVVDDPKALRAAAEKLPCVLKYDGLAAGKGVSVCLEPEQVEAFIESVYGEKKFGDARVVVEECLSGKELSVITAVSDGAYQVFTPARDYKRQLDGDQGPNTGGMGAVASRALIAEDLMERIDREVLRPTVDGLVKDNLDFRGFLYFGLMLTAEGPQVLEFNVRFGDPEAQAILPLVGGDLAAFLCEAADGQLDPGHLSFDTSWCVCLVMASKDYPYRSGRGEVITGLEDVKGVRVYHAGTAHNEDGRFMVNGGRVLSVVCKGPTREEAVEKAYREIRHIRFDGAQYRSDIGRLHFE
jgi:phosphoribosylamine--glycine ligase